MGEVLPLLYGYDEGTLVHSVGVQIQSDPTMGAGTDEGTGGRTNGADSFYLKLLSHL